MIELAVVSLVWAFSFGLIKGQLTGLDPALVAFVRLAISLVVFLPLLRLRGLSRRLIAELLIIGAVQYGLMYLAYIWSYRWLQAYEVALFTVVTPLFVTLLYDLETRTFRSRFLLAAAVVVVGAGVVSFRGLSGGGLFGFLLLQASNACFAFGQVRYKRLRARHPRLDDKRVFALLYAGAVATTGLFAVATVDASAVHVTSRQALTLAYLGVLPSGLAFFLWNRGATKVSSGLLATFNNAKVPLGVAVSLFVFGEEADLLRLAVGGGLVAIGVIAAARR